MKTICYPILAFFLLIASLPAFSQSPPSKAFISAGWTLLHQVDGDLNGDASADALLLLEGPAPAKTRLLKVLTKNATGYVLAAEADKAIPEATMVELDPATGLRIENGVIIVSYSVPMRKLNAQYKYKLQGSSFVLIEANQQGSDGTKSYDINYNMITGKMTTSKKDTANPAGNSSVTQDRKMPSLPPLNQFDPVQFMGFFELAGKSDAKPMQANPQAQSSDVIVVTEEEMQATELTSASATLDNVIVTGDCVNLVFSGNLIFNAAEQKLTLRERIVWQKLTVKEGAVTKLNPAYKGKQFSISYSTNRGVPCGGSAETDVKIVEMFSEE